jgi:hypothetical protein
MRLVGWSEQQADTINVFAIEGIPRDADATAAENAHKDFDKTPSGMREGESMPQAGRAKAFTGHDVADGCVGVFVRNKTAANQMIDKEAHDNLRGTRGGVGYVSG